MENLKKSTRVFIALSILAALLVFTTFLHTAYVVASVLVIVSVTLRTKDKSPTLADRAWVYQNGSIALIFQLIVGKLLHSTLYPFFNLQHWAWDLLAAILVFIAALFSIKSIRRIYRSVAKTFEDAL